MTVTGTAAAETGLTVTPTELTIRDADTTPTVTLVLSPDSISEDGQESSTVTATLSHPSSEATEVEVEVTDGAAAVTQSGTTLRIAKGRTDSTGTVMLTARHNTEDEADKQVRVSGRADNDLAVNQPATVTLTITDDDPPEVEGPEMPPIYTEGGMKEVAEYTAKDRARNEIAWAVSGPDADFFTIPNGELRFQEAPDYEANRSNIYQVTVEASDRNLPDERPGTLAVTVTVEDALGTVRLSSNQPRVGRVLTATVSDPDG